MLRMGWEQHAFRDVSDRPDPEPIRCLLLGPPEVDTHALVLAMAQTSSMKIVKVCWGVGYSMITNDVHLLPLAEIVLLLLVMTLYPVNK